MSDDLQEQQQKLQEKQRKRDRYLVAFYDIAGETGQTWVRRSVVKERAELDGKEFRDAQDHWAGLGLVVPRTMGGLEGLTELTQDGIRAVENSIRIAAEEENRAALEALTVAETQLSPTMDIFISHASADEAIAGAVAELMRSALNLSRKRIRCTSVDGYRLTGGADVNEQLRREVFESRVFIGLITPSSVQSSFVLFELGARWGASKSLMPLLAAGATSKLLPGPLTLTNALSCDSRSQILQLVNEIAVQLEQDTEGAESYLDKVDTLVTLSKPSPNFFVV